MLSWQCVSSNKGLEELGCWHDCITRKSMDYDCERIHYTTMCVCRTYNISHVWRLHVVCRNVLGCGSYVSCRSHVGSNDSCLGRLPILVVWRPSSRLLTVFLVFLSKFPRNLIPWPSEWQLWQLSQPILNTVQSAAFLTISCSTQRSLQQRAGEIECISAHGYEMTHRS